MRRLLAIALLVTGCGRIGFESSEVEVPDAGTLPVPFGCWPAWQTGAPQLTQPAMLSELVNGTQRLSNPSLTADGLQLFYETDANGGDIMTAERTATDQPWTNKRAVAELDSPNDEQGRLSLSSDGLTAVFIFRAAATGSPPPSELRHTTRTTTADSWSTPTTTQFSRLVNANSKFDPELSPDGKRLYYSETTTPQTILVASRGELVDPFDAPTAISIDGMTADVADPALSPDELVMVFSSSQTSMRDLFFAVRSDRDASFGPAVALPGVNTGNDEGDAALSADGCEVIFSSNRMGRQLWVVHVVP